MPMSAVADDGGDVHFQSRLPFNCSYCTNAGVHGGNGMLCPEQFVEETVDITRRYSVEMLWIVDDNFCGS
jgi:hypothetical protein